MMLHVIASSSRGNAYILDDGCGAQLLLECGVQYPRIQHALGYDLSHLLGCLLTHEHGDHAQSADKVVKSGTDTFMSQGTYEALVKSGKGIEGHHRLHIVQSGKLLTLGPFSILPFETEHDAAEPLGWLIRNDATGEKLVFATDTYYIRHRFQDIDYFMLECNFCMDILNANVAAGHVHPAMQKRLLSSHFELDNVVNFLRASCSPVTKKIVLMHLSDGNSDEARMLREVQTAAHCSAEIAKPGKVIELNMVPY